MSSIKSAADGHLPEHHFGQTHSQKSGSHEEPAPKGRKIPRAIHLGNPEELDGFHGEEMQKGTGRGEL